MENELVKLVNKSLTREELFQKVSQNFDLLPKILDGVSSQKAAIRYGCAKVLMDLSEEYPEKLYHHIDFFINLLDSKYRILTWNAMAIIANLTRVDTDKKFDAIFNHYFNFTNDEYMVTVANVVKHSAQIALAKPYLIPKITIELLNVENISLSPHLTEECKRVIIEKTLKSFTKFLDKIEDKEEVLSFVQKYLNSSRKPLRNQAEKIIKRWK
ncbi:hypothetical protein KAI60_01265 [Candidatus Bathyarchaeota archaeon]|nr:hypothetical protein [Candidatus Bathyarchaeota archaeon]